MLPKWCSNREAALEYALNRDRGFVQGLMWKYEAKTRLEEQGFSDVQGSDDAFRPYSDYSAKLKGETYLIQCKLSNPNPYAGRKETYREELTKLADSVGGRLLIFTPKGLYPLPPKPQKRMKAQTIRQLVDSGFSLSDAIREHGKQRAERRNP